MHKIREQYPILSRYTYLNTAYHGMFSKELMEYQQELSLRLHDQASFFIEQRDEFLSEVKNTVAQFLTADESNVFLIPNFSLGFNSLLDALPRDSTFLLLDEDYPSITDAVQRRRFKTHKIKIQPDFEQHIIDHCKQQLPDYFCFSMVQYISGVKMNRDFIKTLKSQFPDLCIIVDATQYLGVEEFRFRESGIDIILASCYKWLHAGDGCGIMAIQPEMVQQLLQRSSIHAENMSQIVQPGHVDLVTMGVLQRAIELHQSVGIQKIEQQITSLCEILKKELLQRHLIPEWLGKRGHSNIFNIHGDQELFDFLRSKGIITSLRGTGIRVSVAHYNNQEDVNRLMECLDLYHA